MMVNDVLKGNKKAYTFIRRAVFAFHKHTFNLCRKVFAWYVHCGCMSANMECMSMHRIQAELTNAIFVN